MKGPLSSLKVLDFSTLPGPFASLLLADMGADVLVARAHGPGAGAAAASMAPRPATT